MTTSETVTIINTWSKKRRTGARRQQSDQQGPVRRVCHAHDASAMTQQAPGKFYKFLLMSAIV